MTEDMAKVFPLGLAGITFDCDGVMIDSAEANRYFYNTVLAAFGLPPMTKKQEDYAFMATARQALERMIPENLHDKIDIVTRDHINYVRDVLPRIKLMPGFLDFMEYAHNLGLRLAIDTNRTDEGIQRVLDFFHLPNYFDPVISASCCAPKPDPAGVGIICASWKIEPCQMLFVGDSVDDRKAAHGGGARFAAFGDHVAGDVPAPNYAALGRAIWPFAKSRMCPDNGSGEGK